QAVMAEPGYDAARYYASPATAAKLVGVGLLWLFVLWVSVRLMTRMAVQRRTLRSILAGQNGYLVLEFALVFPFILSLIFILFQWTELLIVEALVHYAAFSACRTACTYAASIQPGGTGSPTARFQLEATKQAVMQRAAQLAITAAKTLEAGVSKH